MKQTFYTIYDQQNYKPKSKLFDHYICENEKTRIIVPIKFHKNSINPVNFLQLKIKYNIKKILILDRTKPNFKKASIVGDISMDSCQIDITGIDANIGDRVEVFGNTNSVIKTSNMLDTIPYEILATLNRRIKRVYLQ